jgi:hypothetical protein
MPELQLKSAPDVNAVAPMDEADFDRYPEASISHRPKLKQNSTFQSKARTRS